jgi:hypothetical protein
MLRSGEPYRYALPDATLAKLARLRRATGIVRPSIRRNRFSTPPEMLAAGFHASITPPLTHVLEAEGVAAPRRPLDLPAGEQKMLTDLGLNELIQTIHAPKIVPRPKRDRSKKKEKPPVIDTKGLQKP